MSRALGNHSSGGGVLNYAKAARTGRAPETPGRAVASHPAAFVGPGRFRAQITPAKVVNEAKEAFEQVESSDGVQDALPPGKPPPLRLQLEACFGDEAVAQDRYLHDLISTSPGGWIDMDEVLSIRCIKSLRAKKEEVLMVLRDSWLETWRDSDGSAAAIRRPLNKPLPALGSVVGDSVAKSSSAQATKQQSLGQGLTSATPRWGPNARPNGSVSKDSIAPQPKPKAKGSLVKQIVTAPSKNRPFPGRMTGTVVDYDEESGDAKISCRQVEAIFKQYVSVDWRELERASESADMGSAVTFHVELGPGGEPRACELRMYSPEEEAKENVQQGNKRRKLAPGGATHGVGVGSRYEGVIKSFHEGIGVGFISCKETHARFRRDVALSRSECAGFSVGDEVSFVLAVDPKMGTPMAIEMEAVAGEEPEEEENAAPPPNGRYVGIIKSCNSRTRSGVISCDQAGGDVTVSMDELAGFAPGDCVSFQLSTDSGSRIATELEAEEAAG